jgi:hypothetical protein
LEISRFTFRVPLIAWLQLLPYTAYIIGKVRRKTMDTVTCAVIFLLGGVATVIVMRLLFLFWNRPLMKNQDDQYLEQIANALQLKEFGKAEATPRS